MATFSLGTDFTAAPRQPSYVNGRLLGATDLSAEQSTLRGRDRLLGEAVGSGVVRGLTVTSSATTLIVAPGLGVNREGEPIAVAATATLPLAIPLAEVSPTNPARFSCCTPAAGATDKAVVDTGIYLLSARPACRTEGSAATAAPPGAATSGGCVAAWTLAGVEFRVTMLPVGTSVAGVTLTKANLRNLVAGWCYGVDELAGLPADPFGFDAAYGVDQLTDLTDADLPLATFNWDGQSVGDLDGWSARRRVTEPQPAAGGFAVLSADRRIADGQARFHQFQDQVSELVIGQLAGKVQAVDTFPLLPPVGFLPVDVGELEAVRDRLEQMRDAGEQELAEARAVEVEKAEPAEAKAGAADAEAEAVDPERTMLRAPAGAAERMAAVRDEATARLVGPTLDRDLEVMTAAAAAAGGPGFDIVTFFGGQARFGGFIDWELAEFLLRESWYRPPVVLPRADDNDDDDDQGNDKEGGDNEEGGERLERLSLKIRRITYYLVRQNVVALSRLAVKRRTKAIRRYQAGADRSGVYVVFVANYLWLDQTRPPVLSTGSVIDSPTPVPQTGPFGRR